MQFFFCCSLPTAWSDCVERDRSCATCSCLLLSSLATVKCSPKFVALADLEFLSDRLGHFNLAGTILSFVKIDPKKLSVRG